MALTLRTVPCRDDTDVEAIGSTGAGGREMGSLCCDDDGNLPLNTLIK